MLTEKREALDRLANMLLEKEIVEGDELRGLLSEMGLTRETA
jgi:ATP-dependent Zn protease